ncbi:MAG TPA: LPS-assembly protein LptD, partial [Agriterribacter sp.]|nr:LPS-assembly protein LptD [Agriterribacter sp.]
MKNKRCKFKRNYIFTLTLLLLTVAITHNGRAKAYHPFAFDNYLTALPDTVPSAKDSIPVPATDTLMEKSRPDSLGENAGIEVKIDTFSIKMSKDSIDAPVEYEAKDSMVLDVTAQKLYLYGQTGVKYKDVDLKAPEIAFDQQTSMVKARMKLDTAGKVLGQATLVQGDITTVSDSLEFNFKTQKGLTHSSYFQQNELYNYAEVVKKIDAQTIYAFKGRFTTCNLDTPHFAFRARKIKYISKKVAVTGPVGV